MTSTSHPPPLLLCLPRRLALRLHLSRFRTPSHHPPRPNAAPTILWRSAERAAPMHSPPPARSKELRVRKEGGAGGEGAPQQPPFGSDTACMGEQPDGPFDCSASGCSTTAASSTPDLTAVIEMECEVGEGASKEESDLRLCALTASRNGDAINRGMAGAARSLLHAHKRREGGRKNALEPECSAVRRVNGLRFALARSMPASCSSTSALALTKFRLLFLTCNCNRMRAVTQFILWILSAFPRFFFRKANRKPLK